MTGNNRIIIGAINMGQSLGQKFIHWVGKVLTKEPPREPNHAPLYDFERLSYELRPGDVLLTEGRSHVAEVIKLATQSPWTHSMLYIGRLYDVVNPAIKEKIKEHFSGNSNEQLIIEAMVGEGTIVTPLSKYREEHLRICRPKSLSPADAQKVIAYAVGQLGMEYDVRQILDLLRFMFPYSFLPRRWRSSLFQHKFGKQSDRTVCSTMLAEAFHSVNFPILPFAEKTQDGRIHLYQRNPRLYTPKDFDYSPYFDIIKYPFFGIDDVSIYRKLPWTNKDVYCNDLNDCYVKTTDVEHMKIDVNEFPRQDVVKLTGNTETTNSAEQKSAGAKSKKNL